MKLHPIPSEGRFYCGPAAIAAFTGLHPKKEVRAAINKVRGRDENRGIVLMFPSEVSSALRLLGITTMTHDIPGKTTLRQYVEAHPDFVGVLFVTGHFVAVSRGMCVDNKNRLPRPVAEIDPSRKPKSKTQIEREERAAVAKTCQICGRPILAETGLIAHHGYERPRWMPGGQTASCLGARELPFEKSRDVLGKHIRAQHNTLAATRQFLDDTQYEKRALSFEYWTGKYDNRDKRITARVVVTRATFDEKIAEAKAVVRFRSELPLSFDWLKTKMIESIISDIKNLKDYIKMQQARYDGWKEVA